MNNNTYNLMQLLPWKIDAALLTSRVSRRYISSVDIEEGFVLITREKAYYLTDFRYIEKANNSNIPFEIVCYNKHEETINEIICKNKIINLSLEAENITVSKAKKFKKSLSGCTLDLSGSLDKAISSLRLIKSTEEIDKIKQAQKIADKAFYHILPFLKQGVTERDAALELEFFIRKNGAEGISFDIIFASGANGSMPHAIPTDKKIQKGDLVVMDFGAKFDSYHSDMTRTIAMGSVTPEQEHVYNTVLTAQKAALKSVKDGVECSKVDEIARQIIEHAGFGSNFGHSTGHGVGLQIHENPRLSSASTETLKSNMIVTIEPGIYIEGKFGVRIEDMVLVTKDGCDIMSEITKDLIVL